MCFRNLITRFLFGVWSGLNMPETIPLSRADQLLSEEKKKQWESEQEELKQKLVLEDTDDLREMCNIQGSGERKFYVAGVDISFVKEDNVNACSALVVQSFPDLEIVYEECRMVQLTEEYIPGFLGFREVPHIVPLFDKLKAEHPELIPQLLMVDGNGILHPKGFGSACHLGVVLDIPCIGVAKKLFQVDGLEKDQNHQEKIKGLTNSGDSFPLIGNSGSTLGMALRSCPNSSNPIYVSPGHKVSMATAVALVHKCCKHRVPDPVRQADIKSREFIRNNFQA